eukprot:14436-Heterococcus_DN1.PRE.3
MLTLARFGEVGDVYVPRNISTGEVSLAAQHAHWHKHCRLYNFSRYTFVLCAELTEDLGFGS